MKYISIECEYDISGNFGGNNNQEVLFVEDGLHPAKIEEMVLNYVSKQSGVSESELDELYWWGYIQISTLGG